MKSFTVVSVNISEKRGVVKKPVERITLKKDHGVVGDAHAGNRHRQVSLLASEDIDSMKDTGADLSFGDFAENITTKGVELHRLPIGSRIKINDAVLEVTQIGKECHKGCAVMRKVGDCIMPKRGIFAKVIEEGEVTSEHTGYYDF
jgi:cyclic pyranopterin phosphate synthase